MGGEVTLMVVLPEGVALHARPAADLVRAASRLPTPVTIAANGKRANARSILEVLALGATGGTDLMLSASGPRAAEAVNTLASVFNGFGA
jgi:phosphotransferase system HPr (HPr) family protein